MINKQARIEVRLFGALLALTLGSNMVIDALWIFSQGTAISKVAALSTYPTALAVYWFITAALVTPYFLMQGFGWFMDYYKLVVRTACRAVMAGAVLYAYFGFLSRNMDFSYVTGSFVVMSVLNMGMAATLAYGLNAAQIRREEEIKKILEAALMPSAGKKSNETV